MWLGNKSQRAWYSGYSGLAKAVPMTPTHIAKQTQAKGGQWRCIPIPNQKRELLAHVFKHFQPQNKLKRWYFKRLQLYFLGARQCHLNAAVGQFVSAFVARFTRMAFDPAPVNAVTAALD